MSAGRQPAEPADDGWPPTVRGVIVIRGVICDLGGVVYVGGQLLPGAQEALISLRAAGLPVKFITNVSRMSHQELVNHLSDMGLDLAPDDLFTPARAAREFLQARNLVAHLLVHPNLQADLASLSGPKPDVVLMGDAGHSFTYESLNRAFRILISGASLVALGNNRYFKESDGLSLDAGPFVKALEFAANCKAVVLGKPAPAFFQTAVASLGLQAEDVVMIGDDFETDVEGALTSGLQAILVRTGKYREGDEQRIGRPGARVCEDLAAATDLIL